MAWFSLNVFQEFVEQTAVAGTVAFASVCEIGLTFPVDLDFHAICIPEEEHLRRVMSVSAVPLLKSIGAVVLYVELLTWYGPAYSLASTLTARRDKQRHKKENIMVSIPLRDAKNGF